MKAKLVTHRQCEIIPNLVSGSHSNSSSEISRLTKLWQAVKRFLSSSGEPQVWQEYVAQLDANGKRSMHLWWCAYDPLTQRSVYCSSEEELRVWLEQLPY